MAEVNKDWSFMAFIHFILAFAVVATVFLFIRVDKDLKTRVYAGVGLPATLQLMALFLIGMSNAQHTGVVIIVALLTLIGVPLTFWLNLRWIHQHRDAPYTNTLLRNLLLAAIAPTLTIVGWWLPIAPA